MIGFASFPTNTNNSIQSPNSECDIIILKNGEERSVKIIEINVKIIKYKYCNYQEGPLIVINKKDVIKIKYSNGQDEIITTTSTSQSPVWSPWTIVRAFLFLFFIMGFIALIGASISSS